MKLRVNFNYRGRGTATATKGMTMQAKRTGLVHGRETQVDICPFETGFVLSIGRTSIWLERETAEDLVETLERALLAARVSPPAPDSRARPSRRSDVA